MKKKDINKERKLNFLNNILPSTTLKDGYTYKAYEHFIKFHYETEDRKEVFDYFPGAERLHDIKRAVWHDVSIDKLLKKIASIKNP